MEDLASQCCSVEGAAESPNDTSQMTVIMFMGFTEVIEGGFSQTKTIDLSPSLDSPALPYRDKN